MMLWTYHSPDFSLTAGRIDHAKSDYFRTIPTVPKAYRRLWKLVKTSNIIWCYTRQKSRCAKTGSDKLEWNLEVPDSEILTLVDEFIWNRILELPNVQPPEAYRREAKSEALHRFPGNRKEQDAFERKRCNDYWNQEAPPGGWWKRLFVKNPHDGERISALIHHPVPIPWIVSSKRL